MTTGEIIGAAVGVLVIFGTIMKFLQYLFKKFGTIDQHDEEINNLKTAIASIKDSEIKDLENDIKELNGKIDLISKEIASSEKIIVEALNKQYSEVLKMFIELGKEKKNDT
tara:strand:+ start:2328 stop:2660 length:333 start_codon:yes stop_codon:yes gene_type:complete